MSVNNDYEKECERLNVEKWKKAHRIAEIRNKSKCTYEQAEKIYNAESKKDMREKQ